MSIDRIRCLARSEESVDYSPIHKVFGHFSICLSAKVSEYFINRRLGGKQHPATPFPKLGCMRPPKIYSNHALPNGKEEEWGKNSEYGSSARPLPKPPAGIIRRIVGGKAHCCSISSPSPPPPESMSLSYHLAIPSIFRIENIVEGKFRSTESQTLLIPHLARSRRLGGREVDKKSSTSGWCQMFYRQWTE